METYILAIDQGTTSTRAILFDHDRHIVAIAQKEIHVYYDHPGWVEQDPNEIWLSTLSVIEEVMQKQKGASSQIAGIGITNQRETALLWDKKTGEPVYRAIVWQSRQSDGICDAWQQSGYEETIKAKTGLRIDPYFSASKIVWLFENIEGLKERAENGELLFGNIDSWLVWKLSGGKVHITDVTNASRTLLCNIHTLSWDEELLEMFDIPRCILPQVHATSEIYGYTDKVACFDHPIPLCAVVGDQQAALFGQGCFEKGMVKNTYGTGGFVLMNTGEDIIASENGLLSTLAWKIGDNVNYALEGSIFVSGSLMKWLRDSLHFFDDTGESERMALSVEDNAGVYLVPAFVGLGAPHWDDKARASLHGLTFGVTPNHIVRAALESMAYQTRDVLEAMERDASIRIDSLKVDGGAAKNNFLLQFQSDLLGCDVMRFKTTELTALGAASLAGLACGYYTQEDLRMELETTFTAQIDKMEMDELYQGWKKAIQACRAF